MRYCIVVASYPLDEQPPQNRHRLLTPVQAAIPLVGAQFIKPDLPRRTIRCTSSLRCPLPLQVLPIQIYRSKDARQTPHPEQWHTAREIALHPRTESNAKMSAPPDKRESQ